MRLSFPSASVVGCLLSAICASGCGSPPPRPLEPAAPPGDSAFNAVAHEYLEDYYRRQPTQATYLGIHKYDERLEDYSSRAVADEITSVRQFRNRVAAIDPKTLSAVNQL